MSSTIRVLITGGTFDKEYDLINGKLFFQDSHLPSMLSKGRSTLPVRIDTLMMIDSLDMVDTDREMIVKECIESEEDRILITHGTDTMTETAIKIASYQIPKTIVITGAMIPYTFGSSDGMFNLGSAMAFVQCLPIGVYIVMNGKFYNWDNVVKNKQSGYFETKK